MVIDNIHYRKHTNTVGFDLPPSQSASYPSPSVTLAQRPRTQGAALTPMSGEAGGGWAKWEKRGVGGVGGRWVGA